jgi:hypothetical protein
MGGGVFRSTNSGGSWSPVNTGLPETGIYYALAIDPTTPSTLYAGGYSGVFRSTDSGGSWSAVSTGLSKSSVPFTLLALAIDPATPSTLYAGAWTGLFSIQQVATGPCAGDCDGSGDVTVNELITMVNIALGTAQVAACTAGDANGDGTITINEIIAGVNNALNGCSD